MSGTTTGSAADLTNRLQRWLPSRWFPTGGGTRIWATISGSAAALVSLYQQVVYAKAQTRIATSTDGFLDLTAADYLGIFPRRLNETDPSYALRIQREILRPRNTRAAIVQVLEDLTGNTPTVFRPTNAADTGGWSGAAETVPWAFNVDFTISHAGAEWTYRAAAGASFMSYGAGEGDVGALKGAPTAALAACNGTAWTVVAEWINNGADATFWGLSNATGFSASLYVSSSGGNLTVTVLSPGGSTVLAYGAANINTGNPARNRFALSVNNATGAVAFSINGGPVYTGVAHEPLPVYTTMSFGLAPWGAPSGGLNGALQRLTIYPAARTGADLQKISAIGWQPGLEVTFPNGGMGLGYGVAGAWGSYDLPFQAFVTIALGTAPGTAGSNTGANGISGYGSPLGGWGAGAIGWGDDTPAQGAVTDDDIYAAVASVTPAGHINWVAITGG